jgi:hypothetical protein
VVSVVVLCSTRLGLPANYAAFTIEKKPPHVVVQDATGKVAASIPVGANPEQYVLAKSSNMLYVVHDAGPKKARLISAINLITNRVDRIIAVGAGRSAEMLVSDDGHRLYCYTGDYRPTSNSTFGHAFYGNIKPPFEPVITVIDTGSNEVITTYEWCDGLHAAFPKAKAFESWFFSTREGFLILRSRPFNESTREKPGQIAVFSGSSPRPTVTIESSGEVVAPLLSSNRKLLFLAAAENGRPSGELHIIDLQAGTTVSHVLNDHPRSLVRLGSAGGMWVLGDWEMRSISETGELGDRAILLNKPRKLEEGDEGGETALLKGYPGETISLGEEHAAILITGRDGTSSHRVALIDLKQLQVESIVVTLSAGERARILAGRTALALALDAVPRGGGPTPVFWPNLNLKNEALAARPDGGFLYALDPDSHEVTVIDVRAGTTVRRVRVHRSVSALQVSNDGKHLHLINGGETVQKIDLESNELEN